MNGTIFPCSPGANALARLVEDMRVVVCVGSGGVGKTTTAAMLAMYGAFVGKRSLVITIDPARRLANSIGLSGLLHQPRPVPAEILANAGLPGCAPLDAMMLDLQASWDDMVHRIGGNTEQREHILANRFYRYLSRELPGAQEFIACEALYTVAEERGYDLVVLDTPPTQNALDFLDAPARILGFLDLEAFQGLAKRTSEGRAARLGLRFMDGLTGAASAVLSRFTGHELLDELGDFLYLLRNLYEPLVQRTRQFEALLRGPQTRFVVVTSPASASLTEARYFANLLEERGLPHGATVINRILPAPSPALDACSADDLVTLLRSSGEVGQGDDALADRSLGPRLYEAVRQQGRLAHRDAQAIASFVQSVEGRPLPYVLVPQLEHDVHDASRLAELLPWLTGLPSGGT